MCRIGRTLTGFRDDSVTWFLLKRREAGMNGATQVIFPALSGPLWVACKPEDSRWRESSRLKFLGMSAD